jgi:hypothetical protein
MEEMQETVPVAESNRRVRFQEWAKSEAAARLTELTIGALAIVLVFWRLQYSTHSICCGDFDGYYHVKWARLLWDNFKTKHFYPPAFMWLPLTTLNPHDYVDHHYLFHILLIPFAAFRNPQTGGKIAAIIFASLAVFACYWLIVRYEIRYRLLWLLALLASSAPFLYRMNMTKAPPLAILFLIVGIYLMFEGKHRYLLPLGFVFAATYDMFVLLGVAAVIWVVVIAWTERRFEWRPLVFVALGCTLGLVVNPYFPHNLYLFWEHARVKITAVDFATKVGNEWYPYDTREFLANCFVALVAMVVGFIAFDGSDRKRSQKPLFFLIFATALLVMNFRWKRFAEYFPPFAVIFAGFTLEQFWRGRAVFTHLPEDVLEDLQPFLDRQEPTVVAKEHKQQDAWRIVKITLAACGLGLVFLANVYRTSHDISDSEPPNYYAQGAAWMRVNIPAGQTVFNTDWDDFPRLFFFDSSHVYVSGLDPTYLLDKDANLSKLYEKITLGDEEDPGPLIRDRFGSRWVFTDNTDDHVSFIDNAMKSGWFDRVYHDDDCTILHLRETKGEPPPDVDTDTDSGGDTDDNDNSP